MKCAIYGAGSLGTILGAYMTKNGVDVELVNHNKEHVEALRRNGAHITGTVDFTVPVKAIYPEEMAGPYDVVFLMTKQLDNHNIVTFLKPLLGEKGVIVTLQNGIPEPSVYEVVGKDHTIGVVVEWGATMTAPGESMLTSEPDSLSFHMGKTDGITEEQYALVKELLEKMCPVEFEENLTGTRWTKLLVNSTFSGIGAAIGGLFGDVSETRDGQKVAIRCMKECIDVGHAEGAVFATIQGKDMTKLFYYKNPIKRRIGEAIIPVAMKKHRLLEPSMLQDLKKGKPCEVDAINGVVCDAGKKHGIPTPVNDRVREIIHGIQDGKLTLSKENIRMFDDLV